MTAPSVVERIGPERLILDMLGDRKIKAGLTNCINPAHEDKHPSMSVDPRAGVFNCFACRVHGGCLDMAVLQGLGRDHAEAAKALDEKYGGASTNGNGHRAPSAPARPWPYFPKTAEALGWTLDPAAFGANPGLRVPTWQPDGAPARTKVRGERDEDGRLRVAFENDADSCGLINWPAVLDHCAGCDSPSVALLAGETDLLAWTWACTAEGIAIPGFSFSTGEDCTIGEDYAAKLKGVRVHILHDNDPVGLKSRDKNLAALTKAGAIASAHSAPAPHKDVRDFIQSGGSARELLKVTEQKPEAVLDEWDLADMNAEPDDPPPNEFVSRLFIRPSLNVVFGPPQAGKSWAIMALGFDAVMGGGCFLGCEDLQILPLRELRDTRAEVCLWVFGTEDTKARVKRRLKLLQQHGPHAGKPIPRGVFVIATPPGGISIHSPQGWKWLTEKIAKHKATIVVLDTIASLTAGSLDVNKAEQVAPFMAKLNALRETAQLLLFAMHHTRKGSTDPKKDGGAQADSMLGAQTWRALSEGVLMLDAHDGKTQDVTVRSIKAKDIDRPIPAFHATLEPGTGRFRQLGDEEVPPAPEPINRGGRPKKFSAEAILALRPKHPDGLPWAEATIAPLLGISHGTWVGAREAVATGLVEVGCVFISGNLRWPS